MSHPQQTFKPHRLGDFEKNDKIGHRGEGGFKQPGLSD